MELSTARGISNLPSVQPKLPPPYQIQSLNCKTQFPFMLKQIRFNSGLIYHMNSSLRSTEETSAERNPYDGDDSETDGDIFVEKAKLEVKEEDYDTQLNDTPKEASLVDNLQFLKFLEEFDIKIHQDERLYNVVRDSISLIVKHDKLDAEASEERVLEFLLEIYSIFNSYKLKILTLDYKDTYSVLVFGGGGAVTLWLAAAVVGAIDSIPLFPKVLELIGLGYTIWFTSRYLLFKENRDELVARIEQIKQEVLGSKDN